MKVSDLYGKFNGELHIVGSGPSMNVYPKWRLEGKTCLLLNDVQKRYKSLGPFAFSNNRKCLEGCELPYQIVKGRLRHENGFTKTDNHVRWNDPRYYVFSYREPVIKGLKTGDQWSHFDDRALWTEPDYYWNLKGGCSAIFAMQFAVLAGFTDIVMVGCDCAEIDGEHYHEKKRHAVYHDYAAYAAGMERIAREVWGKRVSITSNVPFMGLGGVAKKYRSRKEWLCQT